MENASVFEWFNLVIGSVGSLATVAALIWAVSSTRKEHSAMRREEARRRIDQRRAYLERSKREVAARRWQAERVAAIATVSPKTEKVLDLDDLREVGPGEGWEERAVHPAYADVTNASDLPIYDVRVVLRDDDRVVVYPLATVLPGRPGHIHMPSQPDRSADGLTLEIAFRDAAEVWWHRDSEGRLHETGGVDPFPDKERKYGPEHDH